MSTASSIAFVHLILVTRQSLLIEVAKSYAQNSLNGGDCPYKAEIPTLRNIPAQELCFEFFSSIERNEPSKEIVQLHVPN